MKKIKDNKEAREIIKLFKEGVMFEYYPEIRSDFEAAEKYREWSLIEDVLKTYPDLLDEAEDRKALMEEWIDDDPFFPPPYKEEELELIDGTYSLGYVNFENCEARLDPIDFTRGLFICGEPGGGKSYATLSLIDQMLQIPIEERGFNIIIIQVVKRDADFLLRPYPNLRILEFDDLRYNIWHVEDWDDSSVKHEYSVNIFSKINWLGPLTMPILEKSLEMCNVNNWKPTFSKINRMLIPAAAALELKGSETRNLTDKAKQRISEFTRTREILDGYCHYPLKGFWDSEDIILNLMKVPNPYLYQTIITDILTTMQRLYEDDNKNELRTLIVIDECESVFPVTGKDNDTDNFMKRLIQSCRAAGIGRINVTQQPHTVAPYVPNNSAYFMTFPIAGTAKNPVKDFLELSDDQAAHIQKLAEYGEGIFRDRRFDRPYIITVPGTLDDSHIGQGTVKSIMKPYIADLQAKNTETQKPVRKKADLYSDAELAHYRNKMYRHTRTVLEMIHEKPFRNKTKLMALIGGSRKKFEMSIEYLTKKRFVRAIKCKTSKTREATFYPLTTYGFRLLEIPEAQRKHGAHMFKHDYYKMRVCEHLEKKKLKPILEYLPDNMKTMGARGRIDVYCESKRGKKYANEITLSFSNLVHNVQKCELAGMDAITIICEDPAGIDKAKAMIEDAHLFLKAELKFKKIGEYL